MTHSRFVLISTALLSCACGSSANTPTSPVVVDGSSTLAPLTQTIVADFEKTHRGTDVT